MEGYPTELARPSLTFRYRALEAARASAIRCRGAYEETVKMSRLEPESRVQLSNENCVVDTSYLPHVFEEFVTENVANYGGGQGLSLAVSRAIMEAHGGKISVQSEPNKGTHFTLTWWPFCGLR